MTDPRRTAPTGIRTSDHPRAPSALAAILATACILALALAGCGADRDTEDAGADRARVGDSLDGRTHFVPSFPDSAEAAARYILVAHSEGADPLPGIDRNRRDAKELAHRIWMLATERGADFAALAREYSDDPANRAIGGFVPAFRRGQMDVDFSLHVFMMEPGDVGGVVETGNGFLIIKRLAVRRLAAHHILIAWRGAESTAAGMARTKAQARPLAEEILRKARAGEDPCRLARDFSDDPQTRFECGFIGITERYTLPAVIDEPLFRLKPGRFSDIIESPYGYHIIWRE